MNKMASQIAARVEPALRDALEEVIVDYAYSLDDGQIDRWPDFFTESGIYNLTTRENYDAGLPIGIMRCVGRGMMTDRVKAFHSANIFEPHSYNHLIGRPKLMPSASQTIYKARTNFQVVRIMQDGRTEPFATGRYFDSIVIEKGVAKFQERIVVLDSRQIDILIVVPI